MKSHKLNSNRNKMRTWVVRRIVEEVYETESFSRKEAMKIIGINGNPTSVTILKETASPKPLANG